MLVRAARRKACSEAFRGRVSSYQQLQLPWLCPAYNTSDRHHRRWISIEGTQPSFGLSKRRDSKDASSLPPRRLLNTATSYRPIDDIPFDSLVNILPPPLPSSTPHWEGNQFNDLGGLSSLRLFDHPLITFPGASLSTAPKKYKDVGTGVSGELPEIRAVFDACLQVGKIERAGKILRRIALIDEVGLDALLKLHHQYLRAAIEDIVRNPSERSIQELHKWYELHIRLPGLPQTAETIAYMIKASLRSPPSRRDRLVRRYMDMLDEGAASQLLQDDILTPDEVNRASHIYPKHDLMSHIERIEPEDIEQAGTDQGLSNLMQPKPDVRATDQKGGGLKTLKKTLSLFKQLSDKGINLATATPETKRDIQIQLENDGVAAAIDRWREENGQLTKMGKSTSLQTKSLGSRMWKWQLALVDYLKEELKRVEASELASPKSKTDDERCSYGAFLRVIPVDKLAAITILSCMHLMNRIGMDRGAPLSNTIMAISEAVESEAAFTLLRQNMGESIWPKSGASKFRLPPTLLKKAARYRQERKPGAAAKYIASKMGQNEAALALAQREWSMATRTKVGAFLMSALIEVAKVPVNMVHQDTNELLMQMQPAFSHAFQYRAGKKYGVIIPNKVLSEQLKREPVHSLLAKQLPMLVSPEPWTSFQKGGFLVNPEKVMRIKNGDKEQRIYSEAAVIQGDMEQTFKGLDVLGKTPWRINQTVFDVMVEAWNTGEPIANIPPESPKLKIPPEPELSKDPLERRRWIRAVKAMENSRSGMHSMRCFQNLQLEIARALKGETFYFPHNVDFRGRAYPIPPYFNHMGADHCRGLLQFGKGKELGVKGLRWLKIHLANVFGYDKASLSEREAFAEQHLEKIRDSAAKPLAGGKWWLRAEDPWQCLAACVELRNALELSDPSKFVSYLPIHQDGTCNGLQHYAALGGDTWGAKQVNLEPGDRPADVYTAVANLVKESIERDKEQGIGYAQYLDGKITRKTVKQTVMTNVYGVTFIGASQQIRRQLVAQHQEGEDSFPDTEEYNISSLSSYVATKVFSALSSMFKGAHDIQYWLGESANRISTMLTPEQLNRLEVEWPRLTGQIESENVRNTYTPPTADELTQFKSPVIWTNPLHMPVVQPYRVSQVKIISTTLQNLRMSEPNRSDPVNKRKQLQAFPPNFIHSLDATHMLLSALKCDELGLSFAAVHDSFWTHACDVDTMSHVLRESFIRIHSEDVIGRLAAEFAARYKGGFYVGRVVKGSPVAKRIQTWRIQKHIGATQNRTPILKKKQLPKLDELILELRRCRLLQSSDPAEVEQGKAMITPGSIYEDMAREGDLTPVGELEGMGLGDIPRDAAPSDANIDQGLDEIAPDIASSDQENPNDFNESQALDEGSGLDDKGDQSDDHVRKFEQEVVRPKKRPNTVKFEYIWLPLTFPPLPQKGNFDVSMLRKSQYFFS